MMKKVLLVVLSLAIAASVSFAQTSGPSNVAGYVKITCGAAAVGSPYATPFGLPFKFWDVVGGVPTYGVESTYPSDIVGDQAAPGGAVDSDKIVQQAGNQAWRDAGNGNQWTDLLEDNGEMIPGEAYWYVNKTGAIRDLVLAGEVDNTGNYGTTTMTAPPAAGGNYATPYSWRDSRNAPLDSLGLTDQGFTGDPAAIPSDKVVQQGGSGLQANYIEDPSSPPDPADHWEGFLDLDPGLGYWIVNKHEGNTWDYTYVGVPLLPMIANGNEGVITGASKSSTTKSKANVRATTSVKNSPTKTGKKTVKNTK